MTQNQNETEPKAQDTSAEIEAQIEEAAEIQDEIDEEAHSPEQRIAHLEGEIERLKTEYLRALADAQNIKRLADKRIEDNSKYAVSNFAKELLPVADNLARALSAATAEARASNDVVNTLAIGVEMTARELQTALTKYHVTRIDALNQPFDPNLHQAMTEMENTAVPAGTVIQVYQDGYVINDRLLRPAMVVVSRGGPKREPKAEGAEAETGVDRKV
ncbi:nucleotide exchange factor GrpE [Novispirillum sp. DQ9]|uniref:nucleotide exchange factor GrpE n=1 Tax=Novispirillum sp. DQ9 TaxID=3398612 RepID=UPI003C79ACE6